MKILSKSKKDLLILGAGYAQIPLIEATKKLGANAIVASIPGNYDGFDYASSAVNVDISDPEAVLKAARETGIDGIGTCSLDLGMAAIGLTAESLGLKGPSKEAARIVSNKYEMKKALTAAGVLTPKHCVVYNEEDFKRAKSELKLPVVTKATDLMGSRGIYRCDTFEEAEIFYKKSIEDSKLPFCLIEEYIDGELFCIEALVEDGRPVFILPNNTDPYESAVRTSIGHSIPWSHPDLEEQAKKTAADAISAVGLNNCPVDMDVILKDGKIYIIEITGRSGATGLAELVSEHFGIDYYEMIARMSLGETIRPYFEHPNQDAIIVRTICSERSGILESAEYCGDDPRVKLEFNVHRGSHINKYTNGRDRIGQVVVHADNAKNCRAALRNALMQIRLNITGDIPLVKTPIQSVMTDANKNRIFMKREDMLPFSFGGNKVRFAHGYLKDMQEKGCNALIMYGGENSNMCRILSAMCKGRNIPFSRVHNIDDDTEKAFGANCEMILMCGGKVYECNKKDIAVTVDRAKKDFEDQGLIPYYVYGSRLGTGNEHIPMEEYHCVYEEILRQEKEMGVTFDCIFLASGTNLTHSGLLAGHLQNGDDKKIVGISVTRNQVRAAEVIGDNLKSYAKKNDIAYKLDIEDEILITDRYLCGGYSLHNDEIIEAIKEMYMGYGIPLDPTYTGKAWWGMTRYIAENDIRDKNILFIHTGGSPLFTDAVYKTLSERETKKC